MHRRCRQATRLSLLLGLLLVLGCAPTPAAAPAKPASPVAAVASTAAPPPAQAPTQAAVAASPVPAAVQPLSPALNLKVGSLGLVGEAGVFDALAKGYFREEGLEVELLPFRTTNEMTAPLATGELSFASGPPDPSLFNAVLRDIPLRIVGYNAIISTRDTSGGWMVRQDLIDGGRYHEPKDLKGMTIAISSRGAIGEIWVDRVLAKGGLTSGDVQFQQITFPDTPAAFANKAIDAGFVVEPFTSIAAGQRSASNVLPSGQIYPGLVAMTMIVSPIFARDQPEGARLRDRLPAGSARLLPRDHEGRGRQGRAVPDPVAIHADPRPEPLPADGDSRRGPERRARPAHGRGAAGLLRAVRHAAAEARSWPRA
jgi:ABC-type nitrate/sulfonate/bicarbonate transport system substrate-binding protein